MEKLYNILSKELSFSSVEYGDSENSSIHIRSSSVIGCDLVSCINGIDQSYNIETTMSDWYLQKDYNTCSIEHVIQYIVTSHTLFNNLNERLNKND